MLPRKPIPEGKECLHLMCGNTCRRPQEPHRARKPIKRYSAKPTTKSEEEKAYNEELKSFFDKMMDENEPICSNCGSYCKNLKAPYYRFLWKSCQSHLLEKKNFKSIATHPLNIMVMGSGISGMCWCHDDYGSSWDKASKMHIWPEVTKRFKILYPLISPSEHQFIPAVLLESLKR